MKTLRNTKDKAEILERLQKIQPASQRRWGKMSAHQMICHLSDAYRMFLGERAVSPESLWYPRTLLKWCALWVPIPWPRGFKAVPELDQHAGGTPPAEFAADVQALNDLVDRFTRMPPDSKWQPHPHFGKMSYDAWMRLGYLHTDHHLRQFNA
jgi:hypothetical protein